MTAIILSPPEPHINADAQKGQGPPAGLLSARLRAAIGMAHIIFILALWSVFVPLPAAAVNPGPSQHRYPVLRKFQRFLDVAPQQKYLTRNWGGLRDELERAGVTLTATYTTDLLGNPVGGNTQGFRYAGDTAADIQIDLEKLWALKGMQLAVSGSWRSGENLSAQDIGNTFTVSQIFGGETAWLYAIALEWPSLLDDRLDIRVGRIGAGDDFLASPLYTAFVNFAFDGNPGSVPVNIPSFSVYPVATWGLRTKVMPVDSWSVMTGLYYSDPTLAQNSAHGIDFSIRSSAGIFVIGELGYLYQQGQGATGLPGNYKIGAYFDSNGYPDLSSVAQAEIRGNYGVYVLVDQMVYREGDSQSTQGLTPFAVVTFAPSDRNTFPWFFSAGIVYQGLIPGRDDDTAAFGLAYGKFSKYLSGQHYEMVLEWTYEVAIAPWLTLQPDLQYIIKPSGMSSIANTLVVGMQIAINF